MDAHHLAVGRVRVVLDARRGREQLEIELALETLLDDLHVQQAEEPDAEAESECVTGLRLVDERRVVELELVQRVAKVGVLVAVDRDRGR